MESATAKILLLLLFRYVVPVVESLAGLEQLLVELVLIYVLPVVELG